MDLGTIATLVGLATTAVGATDQAASTASKIKGMFNSKDGIDPGTAQEMINLLAGQLTAANMMNVQISEMLRTLTVELRRENEFEIEKARYERIETPLGDTVYRTRAGEERGEPIVHVCPVCLNRDKVISFLGSGSWARQCQTNREHLFRFERMPTFQTKPITRTRI